MEKKKGDELFIYGRPWTKKWEFTHHVVPPVTASCTFRLDNVERGGKGFSEFGQDYTQIHQEPIYIYDRLDEPSTGMLEQNLSLVEGGQYSLTFSCGMAAISAAFMGLMKQGQKLMAHRTMYGCTYSLITNWFHCFGLDYDLFDFKNIDHIKTKIDDQTRILYLETPSNPTLEVIDIQALSEVLKEINKNRESDNQVLLVVDNTFATSFIQRPLEFGADLVVYSLTKNMCGFGTVMGGAVIGKNPVYYNPLLLYRKDFGGVLSPKSAWEILVHGLPTLPLRSRRQCDSALKIAQWLEGQSWVSFISYPGLESHPQHALARKQMKCIDGVFYGGILIYFETKGKTLEDANEKAIKFTNWIAQNGNRITLAVSLGQPRTLIVAPGAMTHSPIPLEEQKKFGISGAGIRLSIGLEEPESIIEELELASKILNK